MLKMERHIDIDRFDYDLPDERIAKYPLEERSASKLLVYERGEISERRFRDIGDILPEGTLLVFNNTKVIRARIIMHKPSGARIEVFCLEPHDPADYERAFAVKGSCRWSCIVGNLKKWKEGPLVNDFEYEKSIADVNRKLSGIETFILFTEPEHTHISSSIVRELLRYGKDISQFVPKGTNLY